MKSLFPENQLNELVQLLEDSAISQVIQ